MKKSVYITACIALMVLLAAPLAFGQALDGLWFQAKVNIKGYTVDSSGLLDNISGSTVNYFHTTWVTSTTYNVTVYDETGNQMDAEPTFATIGANEDIVSDLGMQFGEGSNYINTYQTSLIKIKRDSKGGGIKSVTFNSIGCEIFSGEVDGKAFYGGCTMKAKTIDPSKLPFAL